MTLYRYEALDASGATHAGELDAPGKDTALGLLHRRGLTPVRVNALRPSDTAGAFPDAKRSLIARASALFRALATRNNIGPRQLAAMTHALATLLKAGLTVDRALAIAASLETSPAAARFFADVAGAVRSGASFTRALAGTGIDMPTYYSSMVEAGELGGSLPQTLAHVSELLRKQQDVRERIQSALIYPIVLACVVLGTLVVLIAFVLPRFQALFAESETALPSSTRAVLAIGEFTSQYWWLMVAMLSLALLAARTYASSVSGREHVHRWLATSRVTLGLPATIETARMLRTLSTLLQNGVTLSAALRVSRGTLGNACLQAALERVTQRVNAGEDFAGSLAAARVFPREAVQLARVGEETGRLHDLLGEAASILESNSTRTLERLLAMMVPAVTILMGFIVAGLIGSVLVGLLSINDLAL